MPKSLHFLIPFTTGYKQIRFIEGYINSETVDVTARLTLSYARCPLCGKKSHSVHSIYERQLMDLPITYSGACPPSLELSLISFKLK